jgi:hypothetical protein
MKDRYKFSVTHKDKSIVELVKKTSHKALAIWANDCVEHVIQYFEEKYPEDNRPRKAIETLNSWINTGVLKMADIRRAALASHAAARAAGQAVATVHVPAHSISAANYALQAIHRAANPPDSDTDIAKERTWQYRRLLELKNNNYIQ